MRSPKLAILGAWLITSAFCFGVRASAADWEARLRSEYPAAADRLESSLASAKCRALARVGPGEQMESCFFLKHGSDLVINEHKVSRSEPASWSTVQCRTPDYYFRLSNSARGAPFTISVIDERPVGNEDVALIANIEGVTRAAFQIDEVPVKRIIGHPSFRVIKAAEIDGADGEPRVAVTFQCDDPSHWIGGGSIIFSPALDWSISEHDVSIIRRAGMSMPDGSRFKGSVKCRRGPSGHVFPEETRRQFVYPDGQLEPERSYRFVQFERADVPDSQFRLSAFGLPDSLLSPKEGNALQPVKPTYSLGAVESARVMVVPFTLKNRAGARMRILGSAGRCGPHGCIEARGLPVDVPASGEAVVEVEVRTPVPAGPFRLELTLFTDSPGQLRLPVHVEGSVRPAPDQSR